MGSRNQRGTDLIHFALEEGFRICNRQMAVEHVHDSWTCRRNFDGALVQIDFIVSELRMNVEIVWHDFVVAIGLDHRCVDCMLRCLCEGRRKKHVCTFINDRVAPPLGQKSTSCAISCCNSTKQR